MAGYVAKTHITALRHMFQDLKTLFELPHPEDSEVADVLGEIRHIETLLGEWRRGLLAETPDVEGVDFKIETRRKAKRTFNIDRIIRDVASSEELANVGSTLGAIAWLRDRRALSFSIRWTDLKKAFEVAGIPMTITPNEIDPEGGDLQGPHVGEVWSEFNVNVAIDKTKEK